MIQAAGLLQPLLSCGQKESEWEGWAGRMEKLYNLLDAFISDISSKARLSC